MTGISKRVSDSWVSGDYGIMKTATDTLTTLPAVLYPTGSTATVGLKGNMQQSSTPSPSSIIIPSETGERTAQLFDKSTVTHGYYVNDTTGVIATNPTYAQESNASDYIPISGDSVTIYSNPAGKWRWGAFYDSNKTYVSGITGYNKTITIPENARYMRLTVIDEILDTLMVNLGSTALPHEPYGYKIPISSANTTTNVYLGEVQTMRKVKKLVLTGEESWYFTDSNRVARLEISDYMKNPTNIIICSHYKGIAPVSGYAAVGNGEVAFHNSANYLYIRDGTITGNNYITYLQQQYAAGTPVTVWYVLATPETAIVNEPIRKIGEYADTLSNISIPVTAGGDTLSVDTTLPPSEVSVNYKGWHTGAVHERDNGAWT